MVQDTPDVLVDEAGQSPIAGLERLPSSLIIGAHVLVALRVVLAAHAVAQRHAWIGLGIPRRWKLHRLRSVALVPGSKEGHMRLKEVDVERERRVRALLDVLV